MTTGLVERLRNGVYVTCAEGYMWEFERRGYLKAGGYIPEVVIEHPHLVRNMYEEYVHSGSDVVEAFTYYAHRDKLRLIGREEELEKLNRTALKLAREVASEHGLLMAGGLSNTGVYNPEDEGSMEVVRNMFKEQVEWAVEEGADYIIGETFNDYGEGLLALQTIQKYGKGVPAVITLTPYIPDQTTDDIPFPEACRKLEEAGAAVVGLNCGRGPATMLPLLKEVRKACKGPIAALPVGYRTTEDMRTFQSLKDPVSGESVYPTNLSCVQCTRTEIRDFAVKAKEIGVDYIGICCGNCPVFMREVAEVYGRNPESSKYSPDLSLSFIFGDTSKDEKYSQRSEKIRKYMKS